jgi:tetratricopeptide (TPR) repeat protein
MIDAVRRFDGYVVQSTGDGILALFGAPLAHEDHAQRALYTALRMQDEIRRYGDRLRAEGRAPIQIRVGANTGEVVVRSITTGSGQIEYTPIGHTVNLASRMQSLANPGSTVVSDSTRKLAEGYFALRPLGNSRVKGISEPVAVFEITGLGALRTKLERAARRGFTKFVGRQPEMAAMARAAELANAGHGQIVAAVAEPGVGKSRLFYEFKVRSRRGFTVMEASSFSHLKANPYAPVLDLLNSYFGVESGDDARRRREKLTGRILTLDRTLEDILPYLFVLLEIVDGDDPLAQMEGQMRRRHTLDGIKRLMLREAQNQPLMVMFEDLHWIDNETQALLNLLADSIVTTRILLLVNYRPEYRHDWGNQTSYTQLRLEPLGEESAAEMLAARLGDAAEMEPLKRLVAEATGGNPFFIEEMIQALFEEGTLVRNGQIKMTAPLSRLKVPSDVQSLLAARIDRLSAGEKRLLQTLAVMGRQFPLQLVREVTAQSEESLKAMLDELERREFIFEELVAEDVAYSFKHALTQEVAANSLLTEQRRQLHERIAQALESLYADRLEDHVAEVANHYQRSANDSQALKYLSLAGAQASNKSAYREAMTLLGAALDHLKKLPESPERDRKELQLQLALGPSMMEAEGDSSPKTAAAYHRMEELAVRLGDKREALLARRGLFLHHMVRGQTRVAHEIATRLFEKVQDTGDEDLLLGALGNLAISSFWLGNLALARSHFDAAFALCDPDRRRDMALRTGMDPLTGLSGYASWALWMLGYPEQALERTRIMFASATERGHLSNSAMALHHGAVSYNYFREPESAIKFAEEGLALANANGFLLWKGLLTNQIGAALVESGKFAEGLARLQQGAELSTAQGASGLPGRIAFALGKTGQRDEGLKTIRSSLAVGGEGGPTLPESELQIIRGELLLTEPGPDPTEAERSFRTAIATSRQQGAKSWELRATIHLARLLDCRGKRDEGRAMLSEIHGWFTEGFDTPDLKDAKSLLDELRA